ncbi:MAG TPA: MFS transporter [Gammaproteobacteria bacterium]|nr:MFS transporter [Gammaproteobacteria bacterium]
MTHPKGLYILFFTEMWERFSYYGMRALLVLYLVNHLNIERAHALEIYATYTGLVYLTPILGGYLADRYIGTHRAILIGAMVMALGHFAMAFESLLYLALGLLIVGNGFFKPNISALVGQLYPPNDVRRDSGFTLFYMGINLGAFFSPLVCGTLGEMFGWHYGFAAAGIGMLFGLVIFLYGQHLLTPAGSSQRQPLVATDWIVVISGTALACAMVWGVVAFSPPLLRFWQTLATSMQLMLQTLALAVILYGLSLGFKSYRHLQKIERDRVVVILILGMFVIFFWMGFEQAGGTLNLFADKHTDRSFLNGVIPASYFQSLNPLLILLLAPIFSIFWIRLDQSRFALSISVKMGLGMIILGLGFVVMALAQAQADRLGTVSPIWLMVVYLLHTIGELFLSPIGLSMVTKLAATKIVSMMMGIWFGFIAVASYLAGTLESLIKHWDIPLYWFLVISSCGAGLLLILISPWLSKRMHLTDVA